ncbi:hypothetical protein ACF1BS_15965 [Streptomyces sp. NPDC014748]|uniref:hypothetical protein n=1 Tax=Streptomyces sp. NPDC014748 TaxID=3364905 RepID=UPI003700113C
MISAHAASRSSSGAGLSASPTIHLVRSAHEPFGGRTSSGPRLFVHRQPRSSTSSPELAGENRLSGGPAPSMVSMAATTSAELLSDARFFGRTPVRQQPPGTP